VTAARTVVEEIVEYGEHVHVGAANGPANGSDYDAGRGEYDVASALVNYEEYQPFGTSAYRAVDSTIEVSPKRYRYAAAERDEETGLDHMGLRYYAPWLGRWTSADPIGLGDGVNRYAYVHGNPVSMRDPGGTAAHGVTDPVPDTFHTLGQGAEVSFDDDPVTGDAPREIERGAAGIAGIGTTGQMEFTPGEVDIDIHSTIAELEQEAAELEPELPSYGEVAANILGQLAFQPVLGLLELAGPGEAARVEEVRQALRPFPYDPDFLGAGSALEQGLIALGSLGVPGTRGPKSRNTGAASVKPTSRGTGQADAVVGLPSGKMYGERRLEVLRKHLESRGVRLDVGDEFLLPGQAGGFAVHPSGSARMVLPSNPTEYVVLHELAHYVHWRRIGTEAYLNLPRTTTWNAAEQFVFDMLEHPLRWNRLSPAERQHAIQYIERAGGFR
jgi:RHS repeat-associated protein